MSWLHLVPGTALALGCPQLEHGVLVDNTVFTRTNTVAGGETVLHQVAAVEPLLRFGSPLRESFPVGAVPHVFPSPSGPTSTARVADHFPP